MVYVAETDEKAVKTALAEAAQAYRGFLPETDDPAELKRFQQEHAQRYIERKEFGAADIALHLLDGEWLLAHDLVLIGSPDTVGESSKRSRAKASSTPFRRVQFRPARRGGSDALDPPLRPEGDPAAPRLQPF